MVVKMNIQLNGRDALSVVDVEVDFLPGGVLAVPNGEQVVPVLNRYILFSRRETARILYPRLASVGTCFFP